MRKICIAELNEVYIFILFTHQTTISFIMIYPHNSIAIQSDWFSSVRIHSINDVQLLRKHYVTRHGFRGAC